MNLFEIGHSLLRQFGPENWTLYKGKHLLNFVDNHDVVRIASNLTNEKHLPLIYALLFGMPGIPCIYYGSEWGAEGKKEHGSDDSLRPCFEAPQCNALTEWIATCAKAHKESLSLIHISEPTRLGMISYAVFCLKKKKIDSYMSLSWFVTYTPPRTN